MGRATVGKGGATPEENAELVQLMKALHASHPLAVTDLFGASSKKIAYPLIVLAL